MLVQDCKKDSRRDIDVLSNYRTYKQNEPQHDKTSKMTRAINEDTDQPGHPPSLVRVFAVCMKNHWVLSYQ